MIWLLFKELGKWKVKQIRYIWRKLIQTGTPFCILKANTIQSLRQTNVQILQCRQPLSEIVGYHRDLVHGQVTKEKKGKANWLYAVQTYSNPTTFLSSKPTQLDLCLKPTYSFRNAVNP